MESSPPSMARFLAPRFWPTWLGLTLLRLIILLPYPLILLVGTAMGRAMYHLLPRRRYIADTNVALCFPHLGKPAQQAIVRESFEASAIALFESALSWWGSERRLSKLYRVEGIEHLQQALAGGKGAILLSGHYTTVEISGRVLILGIDNFHPVYKRARNELFNAVMSRARDTISAGALENSDMRAILRTLKKGEIVWYAPDQDFGAERSVFAPFFGVPTATLTTTARLAKLSGAPVLPQYSLRLPGAKGYLVKILPPLENFPSGDDVADATRVNQAIEIGVNEAPGQYLWVHRRFKTRPPGEPPLYQR